LILSHSFLPLVFSTENLEKTSTVEGVTRREGNERIALATVIGATSAVSPYSSINWGDGVDGQKNDFRSITIQNTSKYDVFCATWANYTGIGPRWIISPSTGTFTSYNYATFYMFIVGDNISSQTLSGVIERNKN